MTREEARRHGNMDAIVKPGVRSSWVTERSVTRSRAGEGRMLCKARQGAGGRACDVWRDWYMRAAREEQDREGEGRGRGREGGEGRQTGLRVGQEAQSDVVHRSSLVIIRCTLVSSLPAPTLEFTPSRNAPSSVKQGEVKEP
ncbi:hypothetical protein E2C01_051820 [Portunus trituberculatus]|uniref:Uncharacterized protein n=1 Tax=Portunus trituberculatus TaxID=210409 RepID=A0A5B7GFX1_PORTR|nr:hypothetical protein [Portunus trituberculatus]